MQNQLKMYADRHKVERTIQIGDLVFPHLQAYMQSSLKSSDAEKLKLHSYGLYKILKKIGEAAYLLELYELSKIHNLFHISCLKMALGQHTIASPEPPPLDAEGNLVLVPEGITDWREEIEKPSCSRIPNYLEGPIY